MGNYDNPDRMTGFGDHVRMAGFGDRVPMASGGGGGSTPGRAHFVPIEDVSLASEEAVQAETVSQASPPADQPA